MAIQAGKSITLCPQLVSVPLTGLKRMLFVSQHGPFSAYLKRFHLSDSDFCSCGRIGTALHYATECIYTVSWRMRKPAPNFEQEWLKRIANNLVSRHKIRSIVKFISENRDLFLPP
ncbi:hypothetical protein AVEN_60800-1 [Araneus ventricosus]|uniref:Uncharacterized protein n=1 Tax=Araneus ventricosus TaxID=182803 RepID=A0A4Y2DC73_ARAVE|nr:hypothetical protein AVEN_59589-1 [Araneus ventricosus]GBM14320.1 hypothetical protein AVEN_60800-1 [Araneus ventricosus]